VMNLVMGSKLLWRLVLGKYDWWKKAMHKKYFTGEIKRCMDVIPQVRGGFPI
jgi:hypothetical protein